MGRGAKGKYDQWRTPEGLTLIQGWARDGLTDEQIAHNMGINKATLYRYKQCYSDICTALKNGKEVADYEVENALFKRACGYIAKEEIQEVNQESGAMKTVRIVYKDIPPDTGAAMAWLKNRRPNNWRDRQNISLDTNSNSGVILLPEVADD